jgi:hypothetical protein
MSLTWGRSLPVSIGLILFEISIIPLAFFYDIWARFRFSEIAQEIMVNDFVSMKKTPAFSLKASDIPRLDMFQWIQAKNWRHETQALLKNGKWEEANKHVESIRLNLLENHGGSHFLCVHFLESVQLAIVNSLRWKAKFSGSRLDSFLKHRALFIWWQAVGYEGAQLLDWMAFPLHQKYKVPILLNDVPSIPV